MVIISEANYPTLSAKEVAKRFAEFPALPDYMKMMGPFVTVKKEEGVAALTLYICDQSELSEAMQFVGKRMALLFDIPGFSYNAQPWLEVLEALAMVGMG
jgi:hypothetical protein